MVWQKIQNSKTNDSVGPELQYKIVDLSNFLFPTTNTITCLIPVFPLRSDSVAAAVAAVAVVVVVAAAVVVAVVAAAAATVVVVASAIAGKTQVESDASWCEISYHPNRNKDNSPRG